MSVAVTRLRIGGVDVVRPTARVSLRRLDVYALGSIPVLNFARYGQSTQALPDPYLGKEVEVWISRDGVAAEVLRFKGDVQAVNQAKEGDANYTFDYRCDGLRQRGERFPVRDDYTGTSTITYNLPADYGAGFVPSRAGRTIGQVLISALEMATNSANLASAGIGNYRPGSGAKATCTVSAGKVNFAVTITDGGSGYSSVNPPSVYFLGARHTVQATGTASVDGAGHVSGVTVTNQGSGYDAAPEVVFSRLPATTLADLEALDRIPPMRVDISGEKLIQALEAVLTANYPNHYLNIDPGGDIRVLDARTFTPRTLTLGVDPVEPPSFHRDTTHGYSRVEVRGRPMVEACEFSLAAGTLEEDFAHDGLSNDDAKAKWHYADYDELSVGSGAAQGAAVLDTAGIDTTFVIGSGGAGYTSAPTITFSGAGGSGAAATCTVSGGQVVSITRTAAGSGYTIPPAMSFSGGGGSGAAATCTLQPRAVNHLVLVDGGYGYGSTPPAVTISGGGGSGATGHTTVAGGVVTGLVLDTAGSGFTSTPSVHIGGPLGSSADYGICVVGDPAYDTLHVVIKSDDTTRTWPTDFWDQTDAGKHGQLMLTSSIIPGLTSIVTRRVVANDAMAAGGTCKVTVDLAIPHTNFDSYSLHGLTVGGSIVWRKYRVVDPDMARSLTTEAFTYPFPYHSADGQSVTLTSGPTSAILFDGQQSPLAFAVDPDAGTVLFERPVVSLYGTTANLAIGGDSTDGIPDDVRVLVGVYKSNLVAVCPADAYGGVPQYDGTIYTVEGLRRTLTVQVDEWRDPAQQAGMQEFACDLLDSVKDTIVEGTLVYLGFLEDLLDPGQAFNVANHVGATVVPTGWEALDLPALGVTLSWHSEGGANYHTIGIRVSNRRAAYTAAPFLVPSRTGLQFGGGLGALIGQPTFGRTAGSEFGLGGVPLLQGTPGMGGMSVSLPTPQTGAVLSADSPAYQAGVMGARDSGGMGGVAGSEYLPRGGPMPSFDFQMDAGLGMPAGGGGPASGTGFTPPARLGGDVLGRPAPSAESAPEPEPRVQAEPTDRDLRRRAAEQARNDIRQRRFDRKFAVDDEDA